MGALPEKNGTVYPSSDEIVEFHVSLFEAYAVYRIQNSQDPGKIWIPGGELVL